MGRILDLLSPVVTARMRGNDHLAVEHPDVIRTGHHGERLSHLGMWHRVVVQIEAHIRRLAHRHLQALIEWIGIPRQGEQTGLFLGKGLPYREPRVTGTQTVVGLPEAPGIGLTVEVGHVDIRARGEEGVAYIANGSLDAPLLISSSHRHRPGLEAVVTGELQQRGMKADGIALAFEHGALQIIVEQDSA